MARLSALGHLGLALEATFGTSTAPVVFIPYDSIKVEDSITKVTDEARRAVLTKDFQVYNATREGSVEIDTYMYPEIAGYLLKGILSNYAVTGSAAPYTHKFQVLNAMSPSYTLSDYNGISEREYKGGVLEELSFKFDTESAMTMSAKFSSFASNVVTDQTPAFTVTNPFMGFQATLNIDGAQNLNMVGGEVSIKREGKLLFTANNTQDPTKYVTGTIEASGKLTFDIEDESEFMMYRNGTQPSLDILFVRDANTSVEFSFGKVDFSKATIDRSQEFLRVDVEFTALFNATDAGMMTVNLKNATATF
jgi:hypothetical protein